MWHRVAGYDSRRFEKSVSLIFKGSRYFHWPWQLKMTRVDFETSGKTDLTTHSAMRILDDAAIQKLKLAHYRKVYMASELNEFVGTNHEKIPWIGTALILLLRKGTSGRWAVLNKTANTHVITSPQKCGDLFLLFFYLWFIIIIIIIITYLLTYLVTYLLQLSFHSVSVVLTLVQTKQTRINTLVFEKIRGLEL